MQYVVRRGRGGDTSPESDENQITSPLLRDHHVDTADEGLAGTNNSGAEYAHDARDGGVATNRTTSHNDGNMGTGGGGSARRGLGVGLRSILGTTSNKGKGSLLTSHSTKARRSPPPVRNDSRQHGAAVGGAMAHNDDHTEGSPHTTPSTMHSPGFWWAWAGFFVLGTVNNLPYVIVASAADAIVKRYCVENLIGAITWANVAFGFIAKGLNAGFLLGTPYKARIWGMVTVMCGGLVVVAFSESFPLALAGIVLAGAACSFGEGVLLGYLKLFDDVLVNGWSSGTGMAGVGGAALYLAYVGAGLSIKMIFLCTLPWMGAYLAAFHLLCEPNRVRERVAVAHTADSRVVVGHVQDHDIERHVADDGVGVAMADETTTTTTSSTRHHRQPNDESRSGSVLDPLSAPSSFWTKFKRCLGHCGFLTTNLCFVYIFEYVISAGLAAKVLRKDAGCRLDNEQGCTAIVGCTWHNNTGNNHCGNGAGDGRCSASEFDILNAYAIFSFCYQAGVLVSRSSLQVFPIARVEVLTVLQGINLVVWLLQARYKMIANVRLLFALMFFVGLLGGASYVNVFHQLLKRRQIPDGDREFTIQLAALFGPTLGITLAAILILVLDQTVLSDA
eukprot:m.200803 g.200803  ORF g.200803 m.200803 type:complete len:617 (-) comp21198_c0_seq1:70-1920(-)